MSWISDLLVKVIPRSAIDRANATPAADRAMCCAATADFTSGGIPVSQDEWLAVERVKSLYVEGKIAGALTPRAK